MSVPSQSALHSETEARLCFEMLLADICAQFVNVASSDVDSKIENAQRVICESLKVDHSSVWQVSEEDSDLLIMTHVYRDPNLKPLPLRPSAKEYFPWGYNKILNKEIVCVPNTAALPPEATKDKESWEQSGIHSSLAFPLSVGGSVIGVLAFDNMEEYDWPEPLQRRLQILAHAFAQALERKRVEQKMRESESRFRLVADTAPVLIWMSGTDKLCTYFNQPWLDFTGRSLDEELGDGWADAVHPEDLQRCLDTYTQSFDRREKFRMEYRLRHHNGGYRWILDIGVPRFNQDGGFEGYIGIGVDVTERKRADEALRASEERFRLAAQAGKMYAYEWDVTTDIVVRSGDIGVVLGPTSDEPLTRQQILARVHPDDRARFAASVTERTPENPNVQITYRMLRPDGSVVWLEKTAHAFFDGQGRTVRMIGMVADITERKLAEDSIKGSEMRYRRIVETTNEGVWLLDSTLHNAYVNRQMAKMLGYEPGEMVGRSVFDFYFPEDAEDKKKVLTRRKQGVREEREERLRQRDGSELWVRMAATPVTKDSGEFDGALAMMSDITERKRAEEGLRESEEKFRSVFRDAGVGMVIVSPEGGFLAANGTFCEYLGYTEEELLGKSVESITFSDDWTAFSKRLSETLAGGDKLQRFEKRCLHKSGRIVYTESTASLIRSRDGKPLYFVGEVLDVTNRREAEEALSNINRRLIEAQEQERTRIGRELHDDINQRLAMLAIELEQLQNDPSEVENRVRKLLDETNEMSKDVEALSHELHSSKLEYLGVVAGMKSWCKEFAERQRIEIDFKSEASIMIPLEIGHTLFRVLQEALHNVIKHSGVKRVDLQLWGNSAEIHLLVTDLGRGFDVEAAFQGRGLGLWSMRERVRLVDGTISIESKPRSGAKIHVCVPLAAERSPGSLAV